MQPTIAVIGGGFSGTLLALWLQRLSPARADICLIERSGQFGRGPAYSSDNPNHLLNVPAGRMGAFPNVPLDFVRWLKQHHPSQFGAGSPADTAFVSRQLYGSYLQELLDLGLHGNHPTRLRLVHGNVVAIRERVGGMALTMASGARLIADMAVLAIGSAPPPLHSDAATLHLAGLWRTSPWQPMTFANLHPQATVLLVGTGLTMVDAVVSLLDAGHTGPIHALSRHGLLPRRHAEGPAAPTVLPLPLPSSISSLTHWIRSEAARASQAGIAWQPVIDSLHPVTQGFWQGLNSIERKRFLRHMRTWWDVHRHRMAPQIADRIQAAQNSGQLRVHAGRITACDISDGQAAITFRPRGSDRARTLGAARVIDCTGFGADITQTVDPLLRAVLRSGIARPDQLRLGLDVTAKGAVLDRSGAVSDRLFAIGPLTKGAHWEITSVPDIRSQCCDLGRMLAARMAQLGRSPAWAAARAGQTAPAWSP